MVDLDPALVRVGSVHQPQVRFRRPARRGRGSRCRRRPFAGARCVVGPHPHVVDGVLCEPGDTRARSRPGVPSIGPLAPGRVVRDVVSLDRRPVVRRRAPRRVQVGLPRRQRRLPHPVRRRRGPRHGCRCARRQAPPVRCARTLFAAQAADNRHGDVGRPGRSKGYRPGSPAPVHTAQGLQRPVRHAHRPAAQLPAHPTGEFRAELQRQRERLGPIVARRHVLEPRRERAPVVRRDGHGRGTHGGAVVVCRQHHRLRVLRVGVVHREDRRRGRRRAGAERQRRCRVVHDVVAPRCGTRRGQRDQLVRSERDGVRDRHGQPRTAALLDLRRCGGHRERRHVVVRDRHPGDGIRPHGVACPGDQRRRHAAVVLDHPVVGGGHCQGRPGIARTDRDRRDSRSGQCATRPRHVDRCGQCGFDGPIGRDGEHGRFALRHRTRRDPDGQLRQRRRHRSCHFGLHSLGQPSPVAGAYAGAAWPVRFQRDRQVGVACGRDGDLPHDAPIDPPRPGHRAAGNREGRVAHGGIGVADRLAEACTEHERGRPVVGFREILERRRKRDGTRPVHAHVVDPGVAVLGRHGDPQVVVADLQRDGPLRPLCRVVPDGDRDGRRTVPGRRRNGRCRHARPDPRRVCRRLGVERADVDAGQRQADEVRVVGQRRNGAADSGCEVACVGG